MSHPAQAGRIRPSGIGYVKHDGGRAAAGYAPSGDCVARALSHFFGAGDALSYRRVREFINARSASLSFLHDRKYARPGRGQGVSNEVLYRMLADLRFLRVDQGERPTFRQAVDAYGPDLFIDVPNHVCAIRRGYVCDTWDSQWECPADDGLVPARATRVYRPAPGWTPPRPRAQKKPAAGRQLSLF